VATTYGQSARRTPTVAENGHTNGKERNGRGAEDTHTHIHTHTEREREISRAQKVRRYSRINDSTGRSTTVCRRLPSPSRTYFERPPIASRSSFVRCDACPPPPPPPPPGACGNLCCHPTTHPTTHPPNHPHRTVRREATRRQRETGAKCRRSDPAAPAWKRERESVLSRSTSNARCALSKPAQSDPLLLLPSEEALRNLWLRDCHAGVPA